MKRRRIDVFFVLFGATCAGISTYLFAQIPNPPETPEQRWVGIAAACAAAVAAVSLSWPFVRKVESVQGIRKKIPLKRAGLFAVAVLVTAALFVMAFLWLPRAIERGSIWASGCPGTVELRVVTSPDGLEPARQLAERYERSTADAHFGCAQVSTYVYAGSQRQVSGAMAGGWSSDHLRDIGPRPDVWLADAGFDVDAVKVLNTGARPIADDYVVATSPLVLGTTDAVLADKLRQKPRTWAESFDGAAGSDRGVVRPDPATSTTAGLITAVLYGAEKPVDAVRARQIEQLIGRSLDQDGYPLGEGLDVLCRHRQLTATRSAVIVTEQALVRFNRGSPLGDKCVTAVRARQAGELLRAVYPSDTRAVDYRFARLSWSYPGQAEAAEKFGHWLSSDQGKRSLIDVGLRPPDRTLSEPLSEQHGVTPGASFTTDPVLLETLKVARAQYDVAHRQGRILLALDASGSMATPVGPGQDRFTVVGAGARRALELMGPQDQFGLWLFPAGQGASSAREAVPIGPRDGAVGGVARRQATGVALDQTRPAGGTPLLRTIMDGVSAVGPSAEGTVSALVVLTDGEDTSSGLALAQVRAAVVGKGVRIFVIAVGDAGCFSEPLRVLTQDTGGACEDTDITSVDATLMDVFGSLWGKAGS